MPARFGRYFTIAVISLSGLGVPEAQSQEVASTIATPSDLSPAQMQVVNYAYGVFPQQLAAVEREAALAQYEAAYWQRRVHSYRPTRSFGTYSATYAADQYAQLQAFAAQQHAECMQQQAVNLWRERQAIVAAMMLEAESGGR